MRFLSVFVLALATTASADPLIVASTRLEPATRVVAVELIVTNSEAEPRPFAAAPVIEAMLEATGRAPEPVRLEHVAGEPERGILPASGFARLHYRFALPSGTGAGMLALILPGVQAVAITYPDGPPNLADAAPAPASTPPTQPSPAAEERGRSGFLANLSSYEPIYAVYGPGTNSDARLQVSLKYQFFGHGGARASWLDGIMFGYTQQMFWDLARGSSPFRDVNYMPELFYALPRIGRAGDWAIGGRFGIRHQSNGRSGAASRSFNIVYVEPEVEGRLHGYDVAVGPRLWAYVGKRSDNPDIAHYRGNVGLFARIGTADGVQLDMNGRLNPTSGRGAAEALVSYPLTRLFGGGPRLYLFGQGFVGYGEDLLDYDRRQTRLRAGIGLTR